MNGKTFKQYIFIFTLSMISIGVNANNPLATKQQVGMFKNSKTCVVLESGVSFFNAPVKEAVQKYWKATGYEFIDQKEFEIRRKDPKYSFIVLMQGAYDKDPGGVSYSYVSLLLGDGSDNLTKMPEFCSVPLSYAGDLDADYEYIVPAVIKFMQIHAKKLETKRFLISLNGLKYYNGMGKFKDKVLLLNKNMMASDANTTEKIKGAYPYYVKLLSTTEIQSELATNPTNTLFNFHVGPTQHIGSGKCFEMIFDTDGNLYYYNSRKITNDNEDGFNLKDFSHLR